MKLLSRSSEEPEINLTSLIDVVLLLLIFFMVSTSFVREAEINISLPEASAAPVDPPAGDVLEIGSPQPAIFSSTGAAGERAAHLRRAIESVMTAADGRHSPSSFADAESFCSPAPSP
jgi:biopolymer transport protein ExbD